MPALAFTDHIHTVGTYANLLAHPLQTLQGTAFAVNGLPAVADGTVNQLWFGVGAGGIVVDNVRGTAWAFAGGTNNDCAIPRNMVVSPMRGALLPVGAVVGARHAATAVVAAGGLACDLWVTEMQNGCTVLILDWGAGSYSLFHIQPSQDNQFNWLGQKIFALGDSAMAGYKNAWLKSEANTIVANTGGVPQRYIMVQSMFEAASGWVTQLLGMRNAGQFTFYRQRSIMNVGVVTLRAERLNWTTWRSYLPWSSY